MSFGEKIAKGHTDFKPLSARARSGKLFSEPFHKAGGSNKALHVAAHHGTKAATPHGAGGMKPHQMKPPGMKHINAGVSIKHHAGAVKIPHSMSAPRPGKGTHNHLPKAPKVPKVKALKAPKIHTPKAKVPKVKASKVPKVKI